MTEALETLERARGHLYSFHQLVGEADLQAATKSLDGLRELGQTDLADQLQRGAVGRDVLPGRWTFQIMEEFDDGYYAVFRGSGARRSGTRSRTAGVTCTRRRLKAERQPVADR